MRDALRKLDPIAAMIRAGQCIHACVVWVPDPTKRGPRERMMPALVRCRLTHDHREEKPLTHIGSGGRRWTA